MNVLDFAKIVKQITKSFSLGLFVLFLFCLHFNSTFKAGHKGKFEEVENKVYAFSDAGSGQVYWLAKSFIVLGDSFVERDEYEQAKATFESVRDGYTPSGNEDDVMDNVEMRLRKLEILMTL